jgi:hypothetical protein
MKIQRIEKINKKKKLKDLNIYIIIEILSFIELRIYRSHSCLSYTNSLEKTIHIKLFDLYFKYGNIYSKCFFIWKTCYLTISRNFYFIDTNLIKKIVDDYKKYIFLLKNCYKSRIKITYFVKKDISVLFNTLIKKFYDEVNDEKVFKLINIYKYDTN